MLRRLVIALSAALLCLGGAAATAHADPTDLVITSPGDTGEDTTPVVAGTGDPAYPVHLLVNGEEVQMVTPSGDGSWSHQLVEPLPTGAQAQIVVQVHDADDSVLAEATTFYYVLAPVGQARITEPTNGATVGGSVRVVVRATDSIHDARLLVDGAENGDYLGWDGEESHILESDLLPEGPHTLSVEAVDGFGRVMKASATTVTVDRTPPAPGTITSHQDGDVITDRTPAFSGTAEPNAPVVLRFDRSYEVLCTATADGQGRWSCTPSGQGAQHVASFEGKRLTPSILVTTTDAVGNQSASAPITVVFDYRAVALPPAPDQPTPEPGPSADPPTDPSPSTVTDPSPRTPARHSASSASAVPELANTGPSSIPGAAFAVLLVAAGLGLHVAARRLTTR